jgi:hypothetical protein
MSALTESFIEEIRGEPRPQICILRRRSLSGRAKIVVPLDGEGTVFWTPEAGEGLGMNDKLETGS